MLGLVVLAANVVSKIFLPKEKPYELGERQQRLDELDEWRTWAIDNVVSEGTLDDVTHLYDLKLKQITNHK